ncbi:MAG TPA: tetratricopeptide repeat protein [Nitrospira sp.]
MASKDKNAASAMEIDRLATQLAMDPHSKAFLPLAEEYCKVGMWEEAVSVLEDGLKHYPAFITAMVVLGRAYDQLNQPTKARAVLEGAVKLSPENLRAHRTLIKIYQAQGLTAEALQSCEVILSVNPQDEEALSVQAALGVPVQPTTDKATKPASAKKQAIEPAFSEEQSQQAEPAAATIEEPTSTSDTTVPVEESESPVRTEPSFAIFEDTPIASPSPIGLASSIMETALHENDRPLKEQAQADHPAEQPDQPLPPSPHAKTIEQLESWLRSIERNRRDRVS